MAFMEFLHENLINTTTQIKVSSSSDSTSLLFDKNPRKKYSTNGFNSNTSTIISIEFDAAQVVDHVILQNHNLKDFRVFAFSVTASALFTVSGNSATSTYHSFPTITVSSVQLQMDTTMSGATEKTLGEFIITKRDVAAFERNPSTDNFDVKIDRKQVKVEMPDGGIHLFNIQDKYKAKIKYKFITTTFRDSLLSIYNTGLPNIFVPFPTSTGWSGQAHEVVWSGDFDFVHSDNAKSQGYDGTISIEETPSA